MSSTECETTDFASRERDGSKNGKKNKTRTLDDASEERIAKVSRKDALCESETGGGGSGGGDDGGGGGSGGGGSGGGGGRMTETPTAEAFLAASSALARWVHGHLYRSRSEPSWALLSSAAGISGEATWSTLRALLGTPSDYAGLGGEKERPIRAVDIGCGRGNVVCAWVACLAELKRKENPLHAVVWGLDADATSLSFARRWNERLTTQLVELGLHDRLHAEIDEEPCCVEDEPATCGGSAMIPRLAAAVWAKLRAQTHVYIFNKGMPPAVLRALVRHVLSHADSAWHRLFVWHGAGAQAQLDDPSDASVAEFWRNRVALDRVQHLRMRGSGEGFSVRVWKRRTVVTTASDE